MINMLLEEGAEAQSTNRALHTVDHLAAEGTHGWLNTELLERWPEVVRVQGEDNAARWCRPVSACLRCRVRWCATHQQLPCAASRQLGDDGVFALFFALYDHCISIAGFIFVCLFDCLAVLVYLSCFFIFVTAFLFILSLLSFRFFFSHI